MTATPTNRLTRAWLTERGYIVALAERFDARLRRRIDLFGFIDYVAVRDGEIVAVQCTSDRNRSSRRQKILAEPNAATWARGGGRILLITWGKHGPRGGRKAWEAHVEWLEPELRGCECKGARHVAVPVYDEHERYTGMRLKECGCAK